MDNELVKNQFNKQAEKFANWRITKSASNHQAYFDFCLIRPDDCVLDVACGTGDLTIYTASHAMEATGVDISDGEIKLARELAQEMGLDNISFDCADVEKLPYDDEQFSKVICKSAFHHFPKPGMVFKEMVRCCEEDGKVSIQDMAAYDDEYVDQYFEKFEKLVDISHNKTMSRDEINDLFTDNEVSKSNEYSMIVDLNVNEYIDHAVQSEANAKMIKDLLSFGESDAKISSFLFRKEGQLYFRRPIYLIIGKK